MTANLSQTLIADSQTDTIIVDMFEKLIVQGNVNIGWMQVIFIVISGRLDLNLIETAYAKWSFDSLLMPVSKS